MVEARAPANLGAGGAKAAVGQRIDNTEKMDTLVTGGRHDSRLVQLPPGPGRTPTRPSGTDKQEYRRRSFVGGCIVWTRGPEAGPAFNCRRPQRGARQRRPRPGRSRAAPFSTLPGDGCLAPALTPDTTDISTPQYLGRVARNVTCTLGRAVAAEVDTGGSRPGAPAQQR